MARIQPYQPLLLRILHNINSLLIIGSLISGFLVYNSFDGRFGKLPLPPLPKIIDIHGTIAVFFFFLLPAFLLYSFHAGQPRLIQPDSVSHLSRLREFIGQYSLHRIVNTGLLIAAGLAALSGRMMKEEWLPQGDLNQGWYLTHLIAWVLLVVCLAVHLLSIAKVGGTRLLLAMFSTEIRPEDSPRRWRKRLRNWVQLLRSRNSSIGR